MLKEVIEVLAVLDSPEASGGDVAELFTRDGGSLRPEVTRVEGDNGETEFVRVLIPGRNGRSNGGTAPTLGVIGRHGGSGARPGKIGFVSDGDGAAAALAAGLKLTRMHTRGDVLDGDVLVTTHVCPDAPVIPHEPVEFMGSPVGTDVMNRHEVDDSMDAIVSIDTTKGNRLLNRRGIAISPTVSRGWILRVSDDLVGIVERVTGEHALILPLSMGDITPYGNGIYHVNSILQPATATSAPVVGVAITTQTAVAGSGTGASHETDIALAARFAVEVGKDFTSGRARLHAEDQLERLISLYGEMTHLQTQGREITR